MKFKVYNQNGKVKITKVCGNGLEQSMFSDLKNGEVAIIEVNTSQNSKGRKRKISEVLDDE